MRFRLDGMIQHQGSVLQLAKAILTCCQTHLQQLAGQSSLKPNLIRNVDTDFLAPVGRLDKHPPIC